MQNICSVSFFIQFETLHQIIFIVYENDIRYLVRSDFVAKFHVEPAVCSFLNIVVPMSRFILFETRYCADQHSRATCRRPAAIYSLHWSYAEKLQWLQYVAIALEESLHKCYYYTQCAPGFSNPNQKVHGTFHFYVEGLYKKDQN